MNIRTTAATRRAIAGAATVLAAGGMLLATTAPAMAEDGTATVTGRVWFDRDADTTQDADEPGHGSEDVVWAWRNGAVVAHATTDADGRYQITGLAPGDYRITQMDSRSYAETTPTTVQLALSTNDEKEVNFGIRGGTIEATTWLDQQGDGTYGEDDGFWQIDPAVTLAAANLPDRTAAPDAEGRVVFRDLPNHSGYQLVAPDLRESGYSFTTPGYSSVIDPGTGRSGTWRSRGATWCASASATSRAGPWVTRTPEPSRARASRSPRPPRSRPS